MSEKIKVAFVIHSKDCKAYKNKKLKCTCGVLQIAKDVTECLKNFNPNK